MRDAKVGPDNPGGYQSSFIECSLGILWLNISPKTEKIRDILHEKRGRGCRRGGSS